MENSDPKVAIVSTIRNAERVIDSFIQYHLGIGFSHIFLFFDDPDDPALSLAGSFDQVSAIPCDGALRSKWPGIASKVNRQVITNCDQEVMSRQILNAALAIDLAQERGYDWLLHIDSDELFYVPTMDIADHFARLNHQGIHQQVYLNYEAVPEQLEVDNFFTEVTLFKKNRNCWPAQESKSHHEIIDQTTQVPPTFFHFYGNGKAAGRLADALKPDGVHRFSRTDRDVSSSTASPFPVILHYPCCGIGHFRRKYETLGAFRNYWFGTNDIRAKIGGTHLDSRDVVSTSNPHLIEAYYRKHFVMDDLSVVNQLLATPYFSRISEPALYLTT